ncbi:Hypothetical predicted protein [Octopus vulgaris]|uniref:Uncharacterized protein n=1 Tax=Octopus vulgaris TaxID=6645 RepID=A0AA36AJW7_OCTVU|nr:Hypothetical predicted protein [Octopus vulgaris]
MFLRFRFECKAELFTSSVLTLTLTLPYLIFCSHICVVHCTSNSSHEFAKKRNYLNEYIRFEFVFLQKCDTEVLHCVICYKTSSNDGMRLSHLERHLRTTHPALADKPKAFFEAKRHSLKQAMLDGSGSFRQQTSMAVEASYEIAMLIAKSMKSHNIGESLIKPNLGQDSANKLSQISLSNDTVKGRIDDLSQDIKDQIFDQVRDSPVFAIQCDETTDIALCSQLLVYVRFVSGNWVMLPVSSCCCNLHAVVVVTVIISVVVAAIVVDVELVLLTVVDTFQLSFSGVVESRKP